MGRNQDGLVQIEGSKAPRLVELGSCQCRAPHRVAEAHRLLYRAKVGLDHAREILRGNDQLVPQVNELLGFIQSQQEGKHGRARERRRAA